MQELNFKNHFKAFILLILGIAASSGISLLTVNSIDIPIPVYILGMLTGFLICSFIFYPKATTGQTLQITIAGVLFNSIILIATYYNNELLALPQIVLKPDFILYLNPAIVGVSFVFSLLALKLMVKMKDAKKTTQAPPDIEKTEDQEDQNLKTSDDKQSSLDMETVPFKFSEESTQEKPKQEESQEPESLYEQLYSDSARELKKENAETEEMFLEDLNENELKEDNLQQTELKSDVNSENENIDKESKPEDVSENQEEEQQKNIDFIPTNIRLTETVTDRTTDSKGKIGAIGKLLVNNRDVENVIESNAELEESLMNSRTNVISNISGEHIYEKFNELKEKFSCIKEMALVDKGGFILANNFEDKQKAQITGALVAGAYHTMENYLSQLTLLYPVRIFFETEETNSFIMKTKEEMLFSIWDKEFKHLEYGPLAEIIELEDFSEIDITPYADIIKIEDFAVSNSEGQIINSFKDDESSQKFASVSSAIFENLKVFLMNLQLMNLTKIVVFSPTKVITIIKAQDKIASFLTDSKELPKITEELLKMEELC